MAKKKGDAYGGDNAGERDFDEEPDFEDPDGFVDEIPDEGKMDSVAMRAALINREKINLCHLSLFSWCLYFRTTR